MNQRAPNSVSPHKPRRRRPPLKRSLILETLRQEIIRGELKPGQQLPPRTELINHFQAGAVTLQQAIDQLTYDGYLIARDRSGTFVASHPPHLFQYGIGFPMSPSNPGWAHYWTALTNAARQFGDRSPRRFRFYHNIAPWHDQTCYPELLDDLRRQRLAGMIFPSFPHELSGTPVNDDPDLPRVAVHLGPAPGFATVGLDNLSLYDRALNYLAEQDRREVAVLALAKLNDELLNYVITGIQARGMRTRPYWIQRQSYDPPASVAQVCHLLMHEGQREYPDALFILDDNLVPAATAGLLEAGVREDSGFEIISHCNFPWSLPTHLPTKRIGFDIRSMLAACIEHVDRQRAGAEATTCTITAQFDHEIPEAVALPEVVPGGAA